MDHDSPLRWKDEEKIRPGVRARRFFIEYVLRPPVAILATLVKGLYWLVAGWWFEPSYHKRQQHTFETTVRSEFSFLFVKHQAGIVPTVEMPKAFRWPVVTLSSEGLLIRIYQQMDQYVVLIAPEKSPAEWIGLLTLLSLLEPEISFPPDFVSFSEASKLLSDRWDLIRSAAVPDFSLELKRQIQNRAKENRFMNRQMAIEINRRLYGE